MKKITFLCFICLISFSCQQTCKDNIDVNSSKMTLKVSHLEKELRACKTPEEIRKFTVNHPSFTDYLMKTTFPTPEIMENQLLDMATNKEITPLFDEVNKVYGDFSKYDEQFLNLFKHIEHYYPDFKAPEINTLVSGFGGIDMAQGQDVVFIGLDYYLGEKATFKPVDFPEYILKYYYPENLTYKLALLMSKRFNASSPEDLTLLSYMIFYGKAMYFVSQVLPCTDEAKLAEYTPEEFTAVNEYSNFIWQHFVTKQLFYETNRMTITKYVDERPFTSEVADKCPGRVGRWLGYQIVKKYMETHPDVTLNQLMENMNSKQIFEESKYRPK